MCQVVARLPLHTEGAAFARSVDMFLLKSIHGMLHWIPDICKPKKLESFTSFTTSVTEPWIIFLVVNPAEIRSDALRNRCVLRQSWNRQTTLSVPSCFVSHEYAAQAECKGRRKSPDRAFFIKAWPRRPNVQRAQNVADQRSRELLRYWCQASFLIAQPWRPRCLVLKTPALLYLAKLW